MTVLGFCLTNKKGNNTMTQYAINQNSPCKDGFIIIDRPHQKPTEIWYCWDEADFIKRVNQWARTLMNSEEYDLDTFDGCFDYHRHDLSTSEIVRFDEIEPHWLTHPARDIEQCLVMLEWVTEIET
jgi:hypothetical protein